MQTLSHSSLMRALRVIAGMFLIAVCLVGLVFLLPELNDYGRFRHKSDDYYRELTAACDVILASHPVSTNKFIELSVSDSSFPKLIRDLQPLKIIIHPQRIWILHGGSMPFGITWERDERRTNVWSLSTACESGVRVVYVATK